MTINAHPSALNGVKVLDLSRVMAGPWCTQILADFGADVLKIEEPTRGDDTRGWGPPFLPSFASQPELKGQSAYFASCNRNKRSLAINFADSRGADVVRRLAAEADILVENFKPGSLQKYGLDYATISKLNPRIVYTSITGFGQQSVYSERAGYDYVAQAMSGLMSVTGDSDGKPLKVGVPVSDLSTGLYAAISTLMALRYAEATGEGQNIDCSLLDTQISMLGNQAMSYLVSGRPAKRHGNSHPTVVPSGTFEAADGTIVIAPGNDRQFITMCEVIGAAEMATDDRFKSNADRIANRPELERLIQTRVAACNVSELVDRLVVRGVPASPVYDIGQIFNDPFTLERCTVHKFENDGVSVPSVAYPARLSVTPARFYGPPPKLGSDSEVALQEWLGMNPSEFTALNASGVIKTVVAGIKAAPLDLA